MSRLLVGMCGAKTETLAVVHDFTYFTGMSKVSEFFTHYFYTNCLFFLIFQNFWSYRSMVDVQVATDCPV